MDISRMLLESPLASLVSQALSFAFIAGAFLLAIFSIYKLIKADTSKARKKYVLLLIIALVIIFCTGKCSGL